MLRRRPGAVSTMPSRPPGSSPSVTGGTRSRWRSPWPWLFLTIPPALLAWWLAGGLPTSRKPIVVGILHSLSGPMAEDDKALVDAEKRAIEDINRSGGLLGRRVEWVIADGASDAATFARRADRLIREDGVDVIVGGGTGAVRRAVVPIVEEIGHLLVCPQRHEGFEESASVVSLGPLPNQAVGPALAWCREKLEAGSFFLVKGDDTWSRSAAAVAADQLTASGARVAGDADFGSNGEAATITERILAADPDVVCCFLPRESCAAFLRRLRESGVGPADLTMLLLGLDEDDILAMPREDVTGTYVTAPFFSAAGAGSSPPRTGDVEDGVAGGGGPADASEQPASARTQAAREAIRMWAAAVRASGTADVTVLRVAIRRQTLETAEGVVAIDPSNRHAWRSAVVGRVRADGLVERVWATATATRPAPFPATRSRAEWTRFLATVEKGRGARRNGGADQPARTAEPVGGPR